MTNCKIQESKNGQLCTTGTFKPFQFSLIAYKFRTKVEDSLQLTNKR